MSWADEEIKRIEQREKNDQTDREWVLHQASVIADEAPKFFGMLREAVGKLVEEFSEKYERSQGVRCPLKFEPKHRDFFVITKTERPSAQVVVWLAESKSEINIEIKGVADALAPITEDSHTPHLDVDKNGKLMVDYPSADVASLTGAPDRVHYELCGKDALSYRVLRAFFQRSFAALKTAQTPQSHGVRLLRFFLRRNHFGACPVASSIKLSYYPDS
jgi:hypothetical protein